ncbi:hypothetical protein Nmel_012278 [Mimus melanotis]
MVLRTLRQSSSQVWVESGVGPEELLGSSAIDWERCRGARQRKLTLQRAPQPEELGYRVGLVLRSALPHSLCSCRCRAALIAWGVLSVLGGAFVCGQSAALAVLGLLH